MNENKNLFSATGIPSLFLIFAVLMLVILSLLGYGTARQDLSSSRLSLQQTTAYYNACTDAADFYADMLLTLKEFQEQSDNENTYYTLVSRYFEKNKNAQWNWDTHTLQYTTAFSQTQSLLMTVMILWPDDTNQNSTTRILTWNTIVTADWKPDNHQSVYKGE